jgi:hypothetical protein
MRVTGMNNGMAAAFHDWPESDRTVWVVGQSDDIVDSVFDSAETARAYAEARGGEAEHWWLAEVPFNPGRPPERQDR